MKLVVRPDAVADIRAARDYYQEAGPGLGDNLAQDLDRLLARLEVFPLSAPVVAGYEPVGRAVLRRFPLAVFYLPSAELIEILRVIHTARSPGTRPGSET